MQMCGRHNSCRAGKYTFVLLLLININSLFIKHNIAQFRSRRCKTLKVITLKNHSNSIRNLPRNHFSLIFLPVAGAHS